MDSDEEDGMLGLVEWLAAELGTALELLKVGLILGLAGVAMWGVEGWAYAELACDGTLAAWALWGSWTAILMADARRRRSLLLFWPVFGLGDVFDFFARSAPGYFIVKFGILSLLLHYLPQPPLRPPILQQHSQQPWKEPTPSKPHRRRSCPGRPRPPCPANSATVLCKRTSRSFREFKPNPPPPSHNNT